MAAKRLGMLILALAWCSQASARDGFENIRCDRAIAKGLIGARGDNGPVMALEKRHKDLKLKDLGALDYGAFSSIFWMICDKEFVVLEDNRTNVVRDALQVPPHSASNPKFEGTCKLNGKPMSASVIAILRDQSGQAELHADAAWRVDETVVKLVKIATDDMLCPRDGITEPGHRP